MWERNRSTVGTPPTPVLDKYLIPMLLSDMIPEVSPLESISIMDTRLVAIQSKTNTFLI